MRDFISSVVMTRLRQQEKKIKRQIDMAALYEDVKKSIHFVVDPNIGERFTIDSKDADTLRTILLKILEKRYEQIERN